MTQNSTANTTRYSASSETHGLLARVIENWLTSVNERQYQLPFCQVLAASGETILYVSSHGPFEKGKDVVTRNTDGEIRAYQLKAGDIGLSEWRAIHGEINNLVELAIENSSLGLITNFVPYLVTNGELTDPALEQVRVANVSWDARGVNKTLRVIQKGELLDRFRASHGAYLPRELADFTTFLELGLRDGTFVADKSGFARLLEGILPSAQSRVSDLDATRAAASIVLLAAYISRSVQAEDNHWALFEYWVMAACYILWLAEEFGVAEENWTTSFDLCEQSAERALTGLLKECEQRAHLVEGDALTDGYAYAARVTVLAGLLATNRLKERLTTSDSSESDFFFTFLQKNLRNSVMWGESAVPFFALAAMELDQNCRSAVAEGLLLQLLSEAASFNCKDARGRGLPNVYYSAEESTRLHAGLDPTNNESFIGTSYMIEPLVQMLARRWRRQALASLWSSLTRVSLATYLPGSAAEWYRWRSTTGALETHLFPEPQSWQALRESAETLDYAGLPPTLVTRPEFAAWFVLVYPHRFTVRTLKLIEDALSKTNSGSFGDQRF